ncbi:MAG TPA: aminotransferase class I/II-fold pyridoxal phosphate-dependent enzyme [Nitrososphaerales archaeon]|nr:aminotransferase class I/II-fold pyridoxal phosphate-dependent enzyme [Nitrososphaerales archaeon]
MTRTRDDISNWKFATRAVHAGEEPNLRPGGSGDVTVPIHLSSTFARRRVAQPTGGFEYSRTSNPTRRALEMKLASLEGARHGLAFSSGMAAEATLCLSLLERGDHVVASEDLYGGTRRLFSQTFAKFGIEFSFVDARRPSLVSAAIRKNTRMIWLESPTNPLMRLCDINAISRIARERDVITVVDNTFASPCFQNPLALGADVVVHSSTKYLGGHSDVIGGALMLSNEGLFEKTKFNQNAAGAVPSPFDCFLIARGIKTLSLRMERHASNAQRIAEFLSTHKKVNGVNYPGLKDFPQRALARKQMSGFGGMLSVELKGDLRATKKALERTKLFSLGESLGGVESLIEHPATMTHASVPPHERAKLGISDTLIRISAGIEDPDDLLADLRQALI